MNNNFAQYAQNFIGKKLTVIGGKNNKLIGFAGTIVDETKNTFTIKTSVPDDVKTILKNQIIFFIGTNEKNIIDGKQIMKRSEDRLKLKVKK